MEDYVLIDDEVIVEDINENGEIVKTEKVNTSPIKEKITSENTSSSKISFNNESEKTSYNNEFSNLLFVNTFIDSLKNKLSRSKSVSLLEIDEMKNKYFKKLRENDKLTKIQVTQIITKIEERVNNIKIQIKPIKEETKKNDFYLKQNNLFNDRKDYLNELNNLLNIKTNQDHKILNDLFSQYKF